MLEQRFLIWNIEKELCFVNSIKVTFYFDSTWYIVEIKYQTSQNLALLTVVLFEKMLKSIWNCFVFFEKWMGFGIIEICNFITFFRHEGFMHAHFDQESLMVY